MFDVNFRSTNKKENCELLIKQQLKNLKNIQKASKVDATAEILSVLPGLLDKDYKSAPAAYTQQNQSVVMS
jgi:hypothetical protein